MVHRLSLRRGMSVLLTYLLLERFSHLSGVFRTIEKSSEWVIPVFLTRVGYIYSSLKERDDQIMIIIKIINYLVEKHTILGYNNT